MAKTIKFKQEYKNKEYSVYLEKSKDVFISVYTARYLFLSNLKKEFPLKQFYLCQGRPTEHDKNEVHPYLKIIKIVEINPKEREEIFKEV